MIYFGHVQGVCFRATCAQLSRGFEVAGYVRNPRRRQASSWKPKEPPSKTAISSPRSPQHFQNNITRTHVQDNPPTGAESAFTVRVLIRPHAAVVARRVDHCVYSV